MKRRAAETPDVKNPASAVRPEQPVLVVSGGSSGIGAAAADLFATRGWRVYALSRHGARLTDELRETDEICHIRADVLDAASLRAAISRVANEAGRIDLLLVNAGYGISGPVEETSEADFIRQFDVNFFGAIRFIQSALPLLRESRGRVICVASVAGLLPIPFQSFYSASKAALMSVTRCLAMECRGQGIRFSALCPGDVSTGFTEAREKGDTASPLYRERLAASLARMEKDERSGKSADFVAARIWRLSRKRRPKTLYVPGLPYKMAAVLAKLLPLRLQDWILGRLYA